MNVVQSRSLRPRLWMLFAGVGFLTFALALGGLLIVRVYDDQLIRQTELELVAQGAALREAFRKHLESSIDAQNTHFVTARVRSSPDTNLLPILPKLRANDPAYPIVPDGLEPCAPVHAVTSEIGKRFSELLTETRRTTLASLRIVDAHGTVIASSGAGLGNCLAHRDEVTKALHGQPASLLRARASDGHPSPLESLSRNTGVRVYVAIPILQHDQVWGAVVLARTPMTLAKAVYVDRWYLGTTIAVLLGVAIIFWLLAAAVVGRPIRALIRQTDAIAQGEEARSKPISRPIAWELAELSRAFTRMSMSLQERTQYIRAFVASVSHEFKTPLASMRGSIELLRDNWHEMTPPERQQFLSNLEGDTDRLSRLLNRLLELARADMSAPTHEVTAIEDLYERIRSLSLRGSLTLHESAAPVTARISLDVLETVIAQLIENAFQHGGSCVHVEVRYEAIAIGEVSYVDVFVSDNGSGVSLQNRAKIFDAFFTTARAQGGTGLGLTIARSILKTYGATIDLMDATDGTCFRVRLQSTRPNRS